MSTHVAVVGAYGSAGVVVAQRLAEIPDVELTLIDDGDPGGGLCILRGCMPSKEVLSAAEHRFAARHDDRLTGDLPSVDLERVVERKDEHTSNWAGHRRSTVEDLATRGDVTFLREGAHFVDDRVLAVGDRHIEADYVVVATGSVVNVPPVPGIEDVDVQTSRDVLDRAAFPETGLVMGLGYIGLELVPYLSEAAGMDLTVVEMLPDVLQQADEGFGTDLVEYYREAFDLEILLDAETTGVEATDRGVRMTVEHAGEERTLEGDELFAFTGRKPALDRLALENTALDPGPEWVADTMQARDDGRVFVVGDANGREPILHVAKEEGGVAADNVLRHREGDALESYDPTHHHVIFSGLGRLPYARVGHSATSAREAGHDPVVATRQAADDGVFRAKDVPEGRASLVVARDGTVLGYQGLHYHADVMAKTMQVIVETGIDVRDVPDRAYHPTTPEILDGLLGEAASQLD